MAYSQFNQ
jgi:hypothetical protein